MWCGFLESTGHTCTSTLTIRGSPNIRTINCLWADSTLKNREAIQDKRLWFTSSGEWIDQVGQVTTINECHYPMALFCWYGRTSVLGIVSNATQGDFCNRQKKKTQILCHCQCTVPDLPNSVVNTIWQWPLLLSLAVPVPVCLCNGPLLYPSGEVNPDKCLVRVYSPNHSCGQIKFQELIHVVVMILLFIYTSIYTGLELMLITVAPWT